MSESKDTAKGAGHEVPNRPGCEGWFTMALCKFDPIKDNDVALRTFVQQIYGESKRWEIEF